jgi:glycosyltransferase involved in cell wall biosynthesis
MSDRLLFVDHAPALGGAEHSLLLLMRYLDITRWQATLAGCAGDFLQSVRRSGFVAYEMPLPRLRRSTAVFADWRKGSRQLADLARKIDARALIANTVRAAIYTAPSARLARRPFIWYMRDFWLSESGPTHAAFDRVGKGLLLASADLVIANSQAVADNLPRNGKSRVIHNGLDPAQWDPMRSGHTFREHYGIPADAALVGMVGRLRPWKGQADFLRMAAQVLRSAPEVHFVVVGGSPFEVQDDYALRLQQQVRDLGLSGRTHFTGQLTDVADAMAAMDVFVHPGSPEPFGLVNIEAMAMAKPVVAFAHGALPEIVIHDSTGILAPPGDIGALAGAVTVLLEDPVARRSMGQAGRRRVLQHFTMDRVATEFNDVLIRLLGERRQA